MTTTNKLRIGYEIASAIVIIALAIYAAIKDGTITNEEAENIGAKVTEGIESVQSAITEANASETTTTTTTTDSAE